MARANRILALLALVVLLCAQPLTVEAQESVPHVLIGTATLNGATPPVDTEIVAVEGSTRLGSAMTMADGRFSLQVMRPPGGGPVTFMVGGVYASERLTDWTIGRIQPGFRLTATDSASTPREPPHVLLGVATLYGAVPPIGTEIVAMVGSAKLGSALTRAGGKFTLQVSRPPSGGVVTFKVGGVSASESLANWEFGKIQPGFNLTFRNITVADALDPLISANNLVSVWHFDNRVKAWYFYSPALGDNSTLTSMMANEIYLIQVKYDTDVVLNGTTQRFTCMGGNCWNYITW